MRPRVSVVIPLFQKAHYIRRCLDSIASQTLRDFEAIVVDDGSTDGGGEAVATLGDGRFRLIRQRNAGESAARNRGLEAARADWVAFLDADDEWRPEFLASTLERTEGDAQLVGVFTNVYDSSLRRPLLRMTGGGRLDDYVAFVLANHVGMTAMGSLVRREAMLECGGFRAGRTVDEVGEDQDAFARLAWGGGGIDYVPEPLAIYHSEVPNGSTARARNGRPHMPPRILSYRSLRAAGRIPSHLLSSSAALSERLLLDHAAALINFGLRGEALRTLAVECDWAALRRGRFWELVARGVLPTEVHAIVRKRLARDPLFAGAFLADG